MSDDVFVKNRKIQDYSENPTLAWLNAKLLPGDLILTARGDKAVNAIVGYQNKFSEFPAASKKFTHVAIYVGSSAVVHSTPEPSLDSQFSGGVRQDGLNDFLEEGMTFSAIRFPGLTGELYESLVEAAKSRIGIPYDYHAIARCVGVSRLWLRVSRYISAFRSATQDEARGLVCSDFAFVVFDEVFQDRNPCNYPGGNPAPVMMPCAFFANPNFVDVDIEALVQPS